MSKNPTTLDLFLKLIRELDRAESVEAIFNVASTLAHQIIPSDRASVTTFHYDEKTLEARSIVDDRTSDCSTQELGFCFTLKGNSADYIEYAMQPKIWCPSDSSNFDPAQNLSELGIKSVMNVPLVSDEEFLGTLNLGSRSRVFEPDELLRFRQIAALVGISLDRFADLTRVKATSKRYLLYAQQLEYLNTLSEQLLGVSTLKSVLEKTKHCVNQLVGARRVSFCTLEPDVKSIRIKALVGGTSDQPGLTVPLEDSGLADCLIRGRAFYIPDLLEAPNKAHRSLGRSGLAHLWAFPIKRDQEILGALIIATEKTQLASEEATAILGTLARLLEATINRIAASAPDEVINCVKVSSQSARTALIPKNREHYLLQLRQQLESYRDTDTSFVLMSIDPGPFRECLYSYGHSAGNYILKELSQRLHRVLRPTDSITLLNDRFLVQLPINHNGESLAAIARRILAALGQPIALDSGLVELGLSIGLSRYPEDGCLAEVLLDQTESAMYQAMEMSGNSFATHNDRSSAPHPAQMQHAKAAIFALATD
ncbi:MAG: diguanylate cyclase [Granulosicoccus sp.]|nr:diguanylate cyclase [Granulosicoccus sp.]